VFKPFNRFAQFNPPDRIRGPFKPSLTTFEPLNHAEEIFNGLNEVGHAARD